MKLLQQIKIGLSLLVCFSFLLWSCTSKQQDAAQHTHTANETYTCPMHPQIIKDKPGDCPICGMKLVKKEDSNTAAVKNVALESLLKPTNAFVVSNIPVIKMQQKDTAVTISALGSITYDTRYNYSIASRVSGRIEKLYIKYRYEHVHKGAAIMEIYSPEINTAQQNLLFLLKNDPDNNSLIDAATQKLLLLGMSNEQVNDVVRSKKMMYTISVYSPYTGHVHEAGTMSENNNASMNNFTEELPLKEGMYVQKGQSLFSVFNTEKAWALLNIYADQQALIKQGNKVTITPETKPGKQISGTINFIEPFFRNDSKTITARVYFNNEDLQIPIGSQVSAVIETNNSKAFWLPKDAVLSLGLNKVVFKKEDGGFRAQKVITGIANNDLIQIVSGLNPTEEVAANAQYLIDSESFIQVKN
ncbi:MAG TPA: efflux RND transporter periplasmic adaptor subunit [Panacibacter sp.]|mgnify:FL=1|nr:efflux RND transporter periplasmic adaptor subunit [Panacibacter sp.]